MNKNMDFLKNIKLFLVFLFAVILILPGSAVFAANAGFAPSGGVWFAPAKFFSGQDIKIYAIVFNDDYDSLSGTVSFYDNDIPIGQKSFDNILRDDAGQASIIWKTLFGMQNFSAKLTNIKAVNNGEAVDIDPATLSQGGETKTQIFIDDDTDKDGIGDKEDEDDDNDGLTDAQELSYGSNKKVVDTDSDGLTDYQESILGTDLTKKDSDNDGFQDTIDKYPMNPSKHTDEIPVVQKIEAETKTESVVVAPVPKKIEPPAPAPDVATSTQINETVATDTQKIGVKEFSNASEINDSNAPSFVPVYILFAAFLTFAFSIAFAILYIRSKKDL